MLFQMFTGHHRSNKQQKSSVQPTDVVNLTQKEIEDCLLGLLKHPTRDRRPIQKLVPEALLEKVSHFKKLDIYFHYKRASMHFYNFFFRIVVEIFCDSNVILQNDN